MKQPKRSSRKDKSLNPKGKECASIPRCPIVAMGASAGGLEVFQLFFSRMPADSGMAFVLIQHLDPHHDTLMPELLAKHTTMKVLRAEDKLELKGNHVYVIPPNVALSMDGCSLRTTSLPPSSDRKLIDLFFRSLATDQHENVVGIVLSGTGTDGTLGLKAIKEHGGLTIAQTPDTAKFDSMPRHAVSTGFVDYVLPVQEMPTRIMEYVKHLDILHNRQGAEAIQKEASAFLPKIFPILRKRTGHDFSSYKQSTLVRRIQRRMQLAYLDSTTKYLQYLRKTPDEVDALFKDLLIGVTQFFRDRESFEVLERKIIPALFKEKGKDHQVRIWVPGCASGEEAYSFAILLAEFAENLPSPPRIQVFATDLDVDAVDFARRARYPEEIADQVPAKRLKRFFKKVGTAYEVIDEIREACIFSPHNLIKDPPFSRLDLISCRNLLIYLESDLQKKLLPLFHYALNPCGFLFLGPSENIASHSELFRAIDQKHRIFQRKPTLLHSSTHLPVIDPGRVTKLHTVALPAVNAPKEQSLARSIERLILEEFAPANAVINTHGEVLYFSGNIGKYLEPPTGIPNNKIVAMARKNLRLELRTVVHRAIATGKEVTRENIKVTTGRDVQQLDLVVRPLTELGNDPELFIVLFRELIPAKTLPSAPAEDFADHEHPVIKQLENELRTTKEDLQTTIEELETSNEELKSANEELLSMNEELQSANEELQTSKEEVQSANDELQRKIEEVETASMELRRAHEERARLAAIVQNSEDAIIGKNLEGIITSWNLGAERMFGYTGQEVIGQSITIIIPTERRDEENYILERLRRGQRIDHYETERLTKDGRKILVSLTASPIRDPKGLITGVAKIARDITERKKADEAKVRLAAVVESSDDAIITKTLTGIITSWNKGAEKIFGYKAEEMIGRPITDLFPEDRLDEEIKVLSHIRRGERLEHFETVRKTKDGRLIDISLTVSPIKDSSGQIIGASKIARDISGRKRAEAAVREAAERLQLALSAGELGDWSWDAATDLVSLSRRAADIFGLLHDAPITWTDMRRLLHPEDRERARLAVETSIAKHIPYDIEYRVKRPSGELCWIAAKGRGTYATGGGVIGMIGVIQDITDRKQAEESLRDAQEKLAQHAQELERQVNERTAHLKESIQSLEGLCYTIAHDLRAPLRAVQGFTKIIMDDYAPAFDENGRHLAQRIVDGATRMDTLIRDLLDYAKLSQIQIPSRNVDLDALVQKVVQQMSPEIEARNATLEIQPLPTVQGNETLLQQVFTNLFSNALKFVPPNVSPRIVVWATRTERYQRIFVQDNGIGIEREHHDRVFGMFQRLHHDEKTYPGTGIGLAIVKKAMERMGGRVGIVPESPEGSSFYVDFKPETTP